MDCSCPLPQESPGRPCLPCRRPPGWPDRGPGPVKRASFHPPRLEAARAISARIDPAIRSRIFGGQDGDIGQASGYLGHHAPLGPVTQPRGAENGDHPPAGHFAGGLQRRLNALGVCAKSTRALKSCPSSMRSMRPGTPLQAGNPGLNGFLAECPMPTTAAEIAARQLETLKSPTRLQVDRKAETRAGGNKRCPVWPITDPVRPHPSAGCSE